MKKRIVSFLAAMVMLLALCPSASASFDVATRESVAVVATFLDLDAGERGWGWGSGFFVGNDGEDPTYLVTNYHVIERFVDFGEGDLHRYSVRVERVDGHDVEHWTMYNSEDTRGSFTGRSKIRVYYDAGTFDEAYIVEYNAILDIAVLKLNAPTTQRKPIALCKPTDSMVGSDAYAVGYPGLAENLFAGSTTSWGLSDATVTKGSISRLFTTEGTGRTNIQFDGSIRAGNSGGPLVNTSGAAIGVNTWSVDSSSQDQSTGVITTDSLHYAISIDEVIPLLNRNSVPYTLVDDGVVKDPSTSTAAPSQNQTNPTGTGDKNTASNGQQNETAEDEAKAKEEQERKEKEEQARKEKEKEEEERKAQEERERKEREEKIKTIAIIAGAAVAAVAIIGFVVYMIKKPKRPDNDNNNNGGGGVNPSPAQTEYRIQAESGAFAGRRFAVNGQVRIGSDPSRNDLVYPGTPGISRAHCVVSVQNGQLYIQDVGSSYGTFVSGRRLTPNQQVPLRNGDRFWLGSEKEMFQAVIKGGR